MESFFLKFEILGGWENGDEGGQKWRQQEVLEHFIKEWFKAIILEVHQDYKTMLESLLHNIAEPFPEKSKVCLKNVLLLYLGILDKETVKPLVHLLLSSSYP